MAKKKTLRQRMLDAETKCGRWLADGNVHAEKGNRASADRCYEKAQYWLDVANDLRDKELLEQIKRSDG